MSKLKAELWPTDINWLETVLHLYEMGGNEIIPEIALVLKTFIEKGLINLENRLSFETIFTTCWRVTSASTKNKVYFMAMKNLLSTIINNDFLALSDAWDFAKNVRQENTAEKRMRIFYRLIVSFVFRLLVNYSNKAKMCQN